MPLSRSRKGCENTSRHIHSHSRISRSAVRRVSVCPLGPTRALGTAKVSCAPRTMRCMWRRRQAATASYGSTATSSTSTSRQKMENTPEATYAIPPNQSPTSQPHLSPTPDSDGRDDEVARLRARVSELQRERDHLVAIVDILQEISASLHFVDILQAIARKLGDAFGLDRCSIFLSTEQNEVRLVASYEDPTIRNLVVDLNRYPELRRALDSGETVFIPDATNDPTLASIKSTLEARNVRSIVVVPIQWQSTTIGTLFLRTNR